MAKKNNSILKPNDTTFGRTLILIAVFGIAIFLAMFWRLYKLQIVQGDELAELAAAQQTKVSDAKSNRGTIYDSEGNILAMSATTYNVFISPYEIIRDKEDKNLIAAKLGELLEVDSSEILSRMEKKESWYEMIKKNVDVDTADLITAFKKENGIGGIHFETSSSRYYPNGTLACHILGYVGTEGDGLAGIEYKYNSMLKGTDGSTVSLSSRNGTELSYVQTSSLDGNNLSLSLKLKIQKYIEDCLNEAVEKYGCKNGGCCIVMDPKTSGIIAMASNPNFDPNDYLTVLEDLSDILPELSDEEQNQLIGDARNKMWRNKALADSYEPGSVFKTVTLSMALEEGITDESCEYECQGAMRVLGRATDLHCADRSGHGIIDLPEAVCQSCNIAFTKLALQVGAEKFYDYCHAFGFFDKSGIDLNGEGSDLWWSDEVFCNPKNLSSLAVAAWGQTFGITPLQMITALCAEANGGYLMEPYIVESITDPNGNVIYSHEPTVVRQVISNATSAEVCKLLENVVKNDDATGHRAYIDGYRIAGKTGTSEKIGTITEDGEKDYIVSFGGFAPANDPQVAVLFLLDTPTDESEVGIGGGTMAAPYAAKIMKETLDYLGYVPELSENED